MGYKDCMGTDYSIVWGHAYLLSLISFLFSILFSTISTVLIFICFYSLFLFFILFLTFYYLFYYLDSILHLLSMRGNLKYVVFAKHIDHAYDFINFINLHPILYSIHSISFTIVLIIFHDFINLSLLYFIHMLTYLLSSILFHLLNVIVIGNDFVTILLIIFSYHYKILMCYRILFLYHSLLL